MPIVVSYAFWFGIGIILLIIGGILTFKITLSKGDFVSFGIPLILIVASVICLGISFAMWFEQTPQCIPSLGIC